MTPYQQGYRDALEALALRADDSAERLAHAWDVAVATGQEAEAKSYGWELAAWEEAATMARAMAAAAPVAPGVDTGDATG